MFAIQKQLCFYLGIIDIYIYYIMKYIYIYYIIIDITILLLILLYYYTQTIHVSKICIHSNVGLKS